MVLATADPILLSLTWTGLAMAVPTMDCWCAVAPPIGNPSPSWMTEPSSATWSRSW